MKNTSNKKGLTIVELLVSVGILSLIIVVATSFQRDIFSLNYTLQGGLTAQLDARRVVRVMIAELRKASPSALGSYPVAAASSTAVTFYSDVDSNGTKDRVRYFVSGTELKRGVLSPSGNPPTYTGSETVTTLISGFVSSSTLPLFEYYTGSYAGSGTALTSPVDIPSIRLVKVTVIIDKDPNKSPVRIVVTSQVNLRNLKDNL